MTPTGAWSRGGRLRHLLWQEGWKGPATRLFHCNVAMRPPLAVGRVVHTGLPRRPIARSIPSLLAAGPHAAQLQHRIPGEWAAPARLESPMPRWARTHAALPRHVQQHDVCPKSARRRHGGYGGLRRGSMSWETQERDAGRDSWGVKRSRKINTVYSRYKLPENHELPAAGGDADPGSRPWLGGKNTQGL